MPTIYRRILQTLLVLVVLSAVPPLSLPALAIAANAWRTMMLPSLRAWWRTTRKTPFGRLLRKSGLFLRKATRFLRTQVRPRIDALNVHIAEHFRQRGTRTRTIAWAFVVVAALVMLLTHVRTAIVNDYVAFGWQQGVLTFVLGVSNLGLFWVSSPVRPTVKGLFVTVVGSLVISATLLHARGVAIDFFSSYFPFPVSYLPMSYGVGVVLMAFAWASLLFAIFALILEVAMLLLLLIADFKKYRWSAVFPPAVCSILFLSSLVTALAIEQAVTVRGQLFMIALAAQYDFTSSHMCDADASEKVLFIDSAPDRAYAATFPSLKGLAPRGLSPNTLARYLPVKFHTVRCNPLDDSNAHRRWCKGKDGFEACPPVR